MIPIDRTEIEAWGRQFDAKGNFPKLLEKLIRETTPKSTSLQMPSGSAVYMGGWDGIAICSEKTEKVPVGISLWELGTNGDESKANSDYIKRVQDSLGFNKSEVTYIFVTTNVWANKDNWAESKRNDGKWKDVVAYDSRDIAAWLEDSPVSCRWFSILTKNHPYDGIYTAEEYWKMLSIGPKGQLPPKILTAGREHQCKELLDFLSGTPALRAVKGSTKEEAIAFIIASAMLYDTHPKELFFSRSVVVDSEHNFHGLRINKNAINLIAKLDVTGKLYVAALDNGHHVLVPLGPDDNFGSGDIITLPRIARDGQVLALQEMGLSSEEANKYSKEAGRDYTILKNLLGFVSTESKWKYEDKVMEIIPVLLVGRWDETKEGDKRVLEQLSSESYETYSNKLYKWLDVASPPLIKIGDSWRLTSPLDAWTYLAKNILPNDFENLRACFLNVMREIDPAFEFGSGERRMASIRGKESLYSAWCREGLTQSMILIGLHGDKLNFKHSFSAQLWVDTVIKELLSEAPGDLWASRNHEMPLIAEASPRSFFESAYHSLSLDDKPIMTMFIEEDGFISPTSHHTGLLWALEALAWVEDYLLDASLLLAKLASLDPGGKVANRPLNSLREIYKPWHYQTLAPFEDRMMSLEQIIKNEREIGWQLLIGMISKDRDSAFPTHNFRWRLFEHSLYNKYTWSEIHATHSHVLHLLCEYFDYSEQKLAELFDISASKQIESSSRERLLSFLESNLDQITIKDNSAWNKLRTILSHHRSYTRAQWALPEEVLKRYEDIYNRLKPIDSISRIIWMFSEYRPDFPEGLESKELSVREQEELIIERRVEGLKTIYQEFGFQKLKELSKHVSETWAFGDSLARIIDEEWEILSFLDLLKEDDEHILQSIQGFIHRKTMINGLNWIFDLYDKIIATNYTATQLAKVFHRLDQTKTVWDFIEKTDLQTQSSYWEGIYPHFWGLPEEDVLYGIDKLVRVNRFISSMEIVYHALDKIPSPKILEIMIKALTAKSNDRKQLENLYINKLINELRKREDVERSVLLDLEWLYLPYLVAVGSNSQPKVLHEELANNPSFFVQILKFIYKSDNVEEESEAISDELLRARGRDSYSLMRSWKSLPGVDDEGNFDEDFLWYWIKTVRELAKKIGRIKVADVHIGQILAEYPDDPEEPWPPREICKVLELINSENLKGGFSTGIYNQGGSTWRGVFDGGDIEREKANYFRSRAKPLKYDFPQTARILELIAEGYDRHAENMDQSAEKDELEH